jgi:type IV pilus assembly protein PilA
VFSDSAQEVQQSNGESGFTLIELLVVVLIIGILAAIAVPSFLSQTGKATDAQAKEVASAARTAMEAYGTDHGGVYEHVSPTELSKESPGLRIASSTTEAYLSAATGEKNSYSITATATNGDQWTITKSETGTVSRSCYSPTTKKGCNGGERSSW